MSNAQLPPDLERAIEALVEEYWENQCEQGELHARHMDAPDQAFRHGAEALYAELAPRIALAEAKAERYRAALQEIAHTRCAWQLSQQIANEALSEGEKD